MNDLNDISYKVDSEDKTTISKSKHNIKLYIVISTLLLLLILCMTIVLFLLFRDNLSLNYFSITGNNEERVYTEDDDEQEGRVFHDDHDGQSSIDQNEYHERKVFLTSGGYINLPDNWYVKSFDIHKKVLTEKEQDVLVGPSNHGYWPIYVGFSITISNNDAEITLGESINWLPSGVGDDLLPLDDSWEIVKEPSVDFSQVDSIIIDRSRLGYAYKRHGGKDFYTIIAKNDSLLGDIDYMDINDGTKIFIYIFNGDERYRDIVNEIFYKSCVLNSSKLCD